MAIVGDLVANLTADISGFVKPLQVASGLLAGFAAGFSVMESITAFREAEQAGKKLDAVLAATGGAAGFTGDELRKMADDLETVTNFNGDVTTSAAAVLATFTQIRGDVFRQAIVSAQDLSSVMGQDLQSSIVQIGKALNDPVKGMTALSRVGVSFSQQQKEQIAALQKTGDMAGAQAIILKELQTEFGGAAQAMADPLTIMFNVLGKIPEAIGSLIVPSLNLIAQTITQGIVPSADSMMESFAYAGQVIAEYVGGAIQFIRDAIVLAGFAIENFGSIAELAFMQVQLAALQFVGAIGHFFTATMPGWLSWFADNWQSVMFTAFDLATTVFINLGQNIRNAMTEIWDYIASGGSDSLELTWTPLTEGFRNAISELPEIADRIPSELEEALTSDIGNLQQRLSDDLGDAMLNATQDAVEVAKPTLPTRSDIVAPTLQGETKQSDKAAGAALAGSKEALSAIFSSMRGESVQQKILSVQEEQLRIQQEQLDATRNMADADEVVEI